MLFDLGLKQCYQDSRFIFQWLSQLCIPSSSGCSCSWMQNDNSRSKPHICTRHCPGEIWKSWDSFLLIRPDWVMYLPLNLLLQLTEKRYGLGRSRLSLELEVGQSHSNHMIKNGRESSSSRGCQNINVRKGERDEGKAVNTIFCKIAGKCSYVWSLV